MLICLDLVKFFSCPVGEGQRANIESSPSVSDLFVVIVPQIGTVFGCETCHGSFDSSGLPRRPLGLSHDSKSCTFAGMLTPRSRRLPGEYDGASKFRSYLSARSLKRLGAIERAYEDFQKGKIKNTGVMIHYVIQEVDRGEPIVTQEVEIKSEDNLEDLRVSGS